MTQSKDDSVLEKLLRTNPPETPPAPATELAALMKKVEKLESNTFSPGFPRILSAWSPWLPWVATASILFGVFLLQGPNKDETVALEDYVYETLTAEPFENESQLAFFEDEGPLEWP